MKLPADMMESILQAVHNGILVVDEKGRIIFLNRAAERMTGITSAEACGKPVTEIFPFSRMPEVLANGRPIIGEKFTAGRTTVVTNRTPIIKEGRTIGAVAVFQDVTELERLTRELTDVKNYAETLETVVELGYEGVLVTDRNGIVTLINQTYADWLGITKEEAIGKHCTEVVENSRMHIVAQTGIPEIGYRHHIRGRDMIVQRVPIIKDGEVVGAVGKVMFRDISELKEIAERLNLLENKVAQYEKELRDLRGARYNFANIIGRSSSILRAKSDALKAAKSNCTVLIRGESGTGKELFAHAIHAASPRATGPFIKVNCAAIPADILEAELFGYEEGAFTGAKKGGKPGKFELANKGTLFLDEIGDMPLAMQAKILRALQEKEVERLGGVHPIQVDVRIIAATNKNLEQMVEEGAFREDLYYRLNVLPIYIPPLRERLEDLPDLVSWLIAKICEEHGTREKRVTPALLEVFARYSWPGNIRELNNLLERLVTTVDSLVLDVRHLPEAFLEKLQRNSIYSTVEREKAGSLLDQSIKQAEIEAIQKALQQAGGNRSQAARLLGIHRTTLYEKMARYGLK